MGTKSINKKDDSKSNLNKDLKKRKPKSETILKEDDSIDNICKLFRKANEEIKLNNDFITAVRSGKIDEVKKLLKKGADINYTFSEVLDYGNSTITSEKTALMYSIKEGHNDVFNYLIKKGADVNLNIKDSENISKNAMKEALDIGSDYKIIKLLIDKGAEIKKPFELSKVCLTNDDFVMFESLLKKSDFTKEELYELLEKTEGRFKIALIDSMEKSNEAFKTIKIITDKLKSTFHFTV